MAIPSRRGFLAGSLGALASSRLFGNPLFGPVNPLFGPTTNPFERSDIRTAREIAAQPLSTLFLTWQRDPTTTMTIQWIGSAPADPTDVAESTIYYSESRHEDWSTHVCAARPYPQTHLQVYRAELTRLTPDTLYQFRVGSSAGVFKFRTMPAKATDAIHFISGGDCGVDMHAMNNNVQAARQDPWFAVVGGDLGYDNGKSVDASLSFIRNYSQGMVARGGRLIPMIPCIGNHEVDGGWAKPRAKAPFFYALFDGLYPEPSYATLDFGDYLSLVLLDTGHNSPIGGEQTSWLEKQLKARIDHPHVMVVNHVPAYPSFRPMTGPTTQPGEQPKGGTGVDNRKFWTPLFDRLRVPVVLEHHDHTFKRTHPLIDGMINDNGVLYLGDGSWGKLRQPQSPEKLSFLAKASRDYHLTLHSLQGNERFHLALDEFGRVMDVGHSAQRKLGLVAMPE